MIATGARAVVAALGVLAAVSAAHAAEPSLASRAAHFGGIRAATADLEQEREVSLVNDVLRARGRISLRPPDAMRLELVEPEVLTIVSEGAQVTVLDAAGKIVPLPAEASGLARFAQDLNGLLLGGRAPAGLTERWSGPDTVTLTASDPASPFAIITLAFPPTEALPTEIVLHERAGDRTTIRLRNIRLAPVS